MEPHNLTNALKINYFSEKINPKLGWNSQEEPLWICAFCLFSDLLKKSKHQDDKRAKFKVIDVLMVTFMAYETHGFNFKKALTSYYFFSKNFISYSRLIRLLHIHEKTIQKITEKFQEQLFKETQKNSISEFNIDSFPLEIGQVHRGKQLNLYHQDLHGKCASKKKYFIGFKITAISDLKNNVMLYSINYGKDHDATILKKIMDELLEIDHYFLKEEDKTLLQRYRVIYADKGYLLDEYQTDILRIFHGVILESQTRLNMKNHDQKRNRRIVKKRFPIERLFSSLVRKLMGKIHATTIKGFLLKVHILFFGYATKNQLIRNY